MSEVDVVIIGAGLAGLTAASLIIRAGYSCTVLEARDRVGGRTWSQQLESTGAVYENGAAWINDTNQSRMAQLAKEFGLELIEQNTDGEIVLEDTDGSIKQFPYGELPGYSDEVKTHLAKIRDTFESDCQSLNVADTMDAKSTELDSMTCLEYLEKLGASDKAIHTATIWTRAMLGQDPADVSALYFLSYCKAGGGLMLMRSDRTGGGQHLRIREGTQSFAINIAKSLPEGTVQFNSPVTSIQQQHEGLVVSCETGVSFHARKVLSAIPQAVLKTIEFKPPLPPAKQQLLGSFKYGYYQKVLVFFKSAFWSRKGLCGLTQSFVGPAAVTRDTSVPQDNTYGLTCFVGGRAGLEWSRKPREDREEAILKQLGNIFGDHELVRSEFTEMIGHQWNDERWNGYGCPCASLDPGVLSSVGPTLAESFGNIHFAGTETSDVWRGYMEGAVRSGEREAELILRDLKE